jgi:hypothetical protein
MQVHFGQIYIEQGAYFPFTCAFQRYISDEVSSLVAPSRKFVTKCGEDYDLVFNVSAKHSLEENEIRGPTVFRKTRDVEYTIFLPFGVIMREPHPPTAALNWMFAGAYDVFDRLEMDTSDVRLRQHAIVEHILSDPSMFEDLKYVKIFGSDAIVERIGYEHLDPDIWRAK